MRIHDGYRAPLDPKPAAAPSPSGSSHAGQLSSNAAGAAQVTVSDKARELARASHDEQARVESLRSAIQGGTFKVDARAIASKMVGDEDGDGT